MYQSLLNNVNTERADFYKANVKGEDFFYSLDINDFPINPIEIIKFFDNWSYCEECFNDDIDGFTMKTKVSNKYRIVVNTRMYEKRIPFTIVHEIGHIKLKHFTRMNNTMCSNFFLKSLDHEANTFAGAFLMPREFMIDKINEMNEMHIHKKLRLNYLSKSFGVSISAAETRLKFLGLSI